MRVSAGVVLVLTATVSLLMAQSVPKRNAAAKKTVAPDPKPDPPPEKKPDPPPVKISDKLTYDVEWRLIHAGAVIIDAQPSHADLKLDSAGMVSSLFKVHDIYTVNFDDLYCATAATMDSEEGKRHHETKVTYDRTANRATYLERDVLKDTTLHSDTIGVPNCVQDVVGAFLKLRQAPPAPGQSIQVPMSDGRRSAFVRIDGQEREEVKTPAGNFKTIRYEANMLNGVIYTRKGRVFIWLSDDDRHLPVQIRLRMQFPIGTVTLQLEKEEHP
jgi:hypothetical protein